jgi:hypothetical protein
MDAPVRIHLPFYAVETMPQMTEQQHAALLERNRQRVTYTGPEMLPATPPSPATIQVPGELPKELIKAETDQAAQNPDRPETKPAPNTEPDTGESGKTW